MYEIVSWDVAILLAHKPEQFDVYKAYSQVFFTEIIYSKTVFSNRSDQSKC